MHYQLLLLTILILKQLQENGVSKIPIVHLNCRDGLQIVTIFAETSFKGTQVAIINSLFLPFAQTDLDEEKNN